MWEGDGKDNRAPSIGRLLQQIRSARKQSLPASRLPLFFWDNSKHYLAGILLGRPILAGERVPGLREIARLTEQPAPALINGVNLFWLHQVRKRLGSDVYHEVRLEQMLADPAGTFERIYDF